MSKFSKQFNKEARKRIYLNTSERDELRDRLCAFMDYHPQVESAVSRNYTNRLKGMVNRHRALVGVFAVLLLAIIPAAAERSVPGDMLYAVKVSFNEEVKSSILRTPYQQVEWETERISRRLDEAQKLVQDGKLTDESEDQVAEAIREHSVAARESIDKLREEDPDEAAMAEITLSTLFDVHATVLAERSKKSEDNSNVETATMMAASSQEAEVSALEQAIQDSRGTSSAATVSTPSYESLLGRLETESANARNKLQELTAEIEAKQLESITRRLDDVDRQVEKGIALHNEGKLAEARVRLTEAMIKTRKVLTFIADLQVRNSVDIATLVPIEYTEEELKQQLTYERERLQVRYDYILTKLAEKAELDIAAEELLVLDEVPQYFASSSQAVEAGDLSKAGEHLSEIELILTQVAKKYGIEDRLVDLPYSVSAGSTTDVSVSDTGTTTNATSSTEGEVE